MAIFDWTTQINGIIYFNALKKSLNEFKIPVLIYLSVILIKNWQAIGFLYQNQSLIFIAVALALLSFTFSNALIAFDKFKRKLKYGEILILSIYWLAVYIFTIAGNLIDNQ